MMVFIMTIISCINNDFRKMETNFQAIVCHHQASRTPMLTVINRSTENHAVFSGDSSENVIVRGGLKMYLLVIYL